MDPGNYRNGYRQNNADNADLPRRSVNAGKDSGQRQNGHKSNAGGVIVHDVLDLHRSVRADREADRFAQIRGHRWRPSDSLGSTNIPGNQEARQENEAAGQNGPAQKSVADAYFGTASKRFKAVLVCLITTATRGLE